VIIKTIKILKEDYKSINYTNYIHASKFMNVQRCYAEMFPKFKPGNMLSLSIKTGQAIFMTYQNTLITKQ